jgi:endonuclease/exonuclease/phosphatase family metal-dependent hydrolase
MCTGWGQSDVAKCSAPRSACLPGGRPGRPGLYPGRHGRLQRIDEITVASLNLHWGLGLLGQPYDVAAAVCQLDAEVICLQEAWLQVPAPTPVAAPATSPGSAPAPGIALAAADDLAEAAAKLGAALHRVVMCARPALTLPAVPANSGPGELSIAVLTTLPVTDYEVIELGLAPRDDVPRFAQVLTLALARGARVRVVNTHLTHRFTSPVQLRRLRRRLRANAATSRQAPTTIVGDLNMPRAVASLSREYAPTVRGKTWPVKRPLAQLDHILAGRGIEFLQGDVLSTVGSDHLPIRARMAVSRLA